MDAELQKGLVVNGKAPELVLVINVENAFMHCPKCVIRSKLWKPELPTSPRHRWIVDTVGWPQASTFWRRDVFEEFGMFRQDMHYIFDTEFGLRLALAGVLPVLSEDELAVRLWHEAAKSWNRRPAQREELMLLRLYPGALSRAERLRFLAPATAKRLGLYRLGIRPRIRRLLQRQP